VLVYVVRRLLLAALVFVVASFVGFVVLAAPLDPLWKIGGSSLNPELADQFHLREPAVEQYWHWVKGTITGTPDRSHTVCAGRVGGCRQPGLEVWPRVWPTLGHTALLAGLSVVVVTILSLLIGTIAARWPGSVLDVVLRTGSYIAWSIPAFVLAVVLQLSLRELALNYDFEPFPVSGLPLPGEAGSGFKFVGVWAQHLALPVLSMIVRHALRNSLIPFVSLLTLDFGAIFGATLVADFIFAQEGLASYLRLAVYNADPFEVQPLILVGAASVLLFSLLGDLVAARLDPRIRLG
jgi:peptide/nickel transport system permease protein